MSWGVIAALSRPRMSRERSACSGRIPALDPDEKNRRKPRWQETSDHLPPVTLRVTKSSPLTSRFSGCTLTMECWHSIPHGPLQPVVSRQVDYIGSQSRHAVVRRLALPKLVSGCARRPRALQ